MKMFRLSLQACLLGLLFFGAAPARAQDPDLRLLDELFLKRIFAQEGWDIVRSDTMITLHCPTCGAGAKILFIVKDHRKEAWVHQMPRKYLEERKDHCQSLVANRQGRCAFTRAVSIRWLSGFHSQAEEGTRGNITEIVLFYGGHALSAIVQEQDGFRIGDKMKDDLLHALVRLTPAW